jgi:hypothetical protein
MLPFVAIDGIRLSLSSLNGCYCCGGIMNIT